MKKTAKRFVITVEEGGDNPGYLGTKGIETRIREALDMTENADYYTKVISIEKHPDDLQHE